MKQLIIFTFLLHGLIFTSCQKKFLCPDCEVNQPPIANAGPDQVLILPKDSILLDGSNSSDPDGKIVSYKWLMISGTFISNIVKPDTVRTLVKGLVPGIYQYELTVADDKGAIAKDTVQIRVSAGIGTNQPPVANAGTDQTITLPVDSILINGNSSYDPDGTIASYVWTKISGPPSSAIINSQASQTMIKNLTKGVYQFELKVTDNLGAIGKDTMQITVNDAGQSNRPPVACAGVDQTITLPTNSVNLDGSCSTDPDNNITNYLWRNISGPSGFTISNANAVQTQVTNLVQGVYLFELKVTDAGGLFSKDTVIVTVNGICDISNRTLLSPTLFEIGMLSEPRIPAAGAAGSKIVFAGGEKAFICGPDFNLSSAAVDIYDVNTHGWTTATLSKERSFIAVATVGNKIFFAGGVNWDSHPNGSQYNVSYDNVDIYDASTNSWSKAHLSVAREDICAVTIGNKVIFSGGNFYTGNPFSNQVWNVSDAVDIYDLSTNSWSVAKLSVARGGITPVVLGDKVYLAGGYGYGAVNGNLNTVDVYNSSTNTWSTSNLPDDIALKGSYQLGNYIVWCLQHLVKIKNTVTGAITNNCVSGNVNYVTGLKNNGIAFFTGYNSTNNALTQFDFYDPLSNIWSAGKLNQSFAGTASASFITVNNTIYLAGGSSGNDGCNFTYHDKVYILNW